MIEEKYLELINREIDHMISPRQSKKLRKYLKHNPDAQRYYADLLVISKEFSQVKIVEPPQNLKKNIVNALPVGKYTKYERQNVFQRYFETLLFGNKPRYAYVFSAGLITGIIVISLLFIILYKNNSVNIPDLYGAIGANSTAKVFHTSDELTIDEESVKGDVRLSYSDKEIFIDATIRTTQDVNVTLKFNENDVNFREFKKSNNFSNDLIVKSNPLQFTCNGTNHYLIALGRITSNLSPVYLKIYSSGSIVYAYTLLSNPE